MADTPELSVVVPCFNEERRLEATLRRIIEHLDRNGITFELLVVDDGSTDGTIGVARSIGDERIDVIALEPNRGKGHAVRTGMLRATGERVLFTDADLSTPIEHLAELAAALDGGAAVAIGSRALAESDVKVHQPWWRERVGRTFNGIIRLLGVRGIRDTQCGFKLFTREAAHAVFAQARIDRWTFDVEALVIARRLGYEIAELPVSWVNSPESKVSVVRDFGRTMWDLLRIRLS